MVGRLFSKACEKVVRSRSRILAPSLLLLPALAFAWTVGITVQGPSAGQSNNKVVVGVPPKTISGGIAYIYPTAAFTAISASVLKGPAYTAAVTVNNAAPSYTAGGKVL